MIGAYPELAHTAALLLGHAPALQHLPDPNGSQSPQLSQRLENLDRPRSGGSMAGMEGTQALICGEGS